MYIACCIKNIFLYLKKKYFHFAFLIPFFSLSFYFSFSVFVQLVPVACSMIVFSFASTSSNRSLRPSLLSNSCQFRGCVCACVCCGQYCCYCYCCCCVFKCFAVAQNHQKHKASPLAAPPSSSVEFVDMCVFNQHVISSKATPPTPSCWLRATAKRRKGKKEREMNI